MNRHGMPWARRLFREGGVVTAKPSAMQRPGWAVSGRRWPHLYPVYSHTSTPCALGIGTSCDDRIVGMSNPPRTAWRKHFPPVVIHTAPRARTDHPLFEAAKSGNLEAALSLARELLDGDATSSLQDLLGHTRPILLAVTALEVSGFNAIPDAMADILAARLNWPLSAGEIVQNNRVGHTLARAFNRLVTPAAFEGPVRVGASYVLVDDHVGLGGTLRESQGIHREQRRAGVSHDDPHRKPPSPADRPTGGGPECAKKRPWRRARTAMAGTVRARARVPHERRRSSPLS